MSRRGRFIASTWDVPRPPAPVRGPVLAPHDHLHGDAHPGVPPCSPASPSRDAALGYDAMRVIEQALAQAGADRAPIRAPVRARSRAKTGVGRPADHRRRRRLSRKRGSPIRV